MGLQIVTNSSTSPTSTTLPSLQPTGYIIYTPELTSLLRRLSPNPSEMVFSLTRKDLEECGIEFKTNGKSHCPSCARGAQTPTST